MVFVIKREMLGTFLGGSTSKDVTWFSAIKEFKQYNKRQLSKLKAACRYKDN